jgi:hypothetical protein
LTERRVAVREALAGDAVRPRRECRPSCRQPYQPSGRILAPKSSAATPTSIYCADWRSSWWCSTHIGLRIPLKKTALADVLLTWFLSRLNYNGYEAVFVFFVPVSAARWRSTLGISAVLAGVAVMLAAWHGSGALAVGALRAMVAY